MFLMGQIIGSMFIDGFSWYFESWNGFYQHEVFSCGKTEFPSSFFRLESAHPHPAGGHPPLGAAYSQPGENLRRSVVVLFSNPLPSPSSGTPSSLTLVCLSVPNPRRRRRRHNSCSATPSAIFGTLPPVRHRPPPIEFWTLPHPSLSVRSKTESKP